jgi:hypothetical protein
MDNTPAMEDYVARFIAEFHNLQGVTVAEKKKNLYRLLRDTPEFQTNQPLLDSLTSQLQPQTHLERLFFVEFLIHHRRYNELLREFLKGDDIIISRVAKQDWFFQTAFSEIGTAFVTQTLPTLSYSLRLKILKRMVPILDETRGDEVFDALLKSYGISMATNILTCCSVAKIEQVLSVYQVRLWPNQLKLLYDKNPNLICTYLEERRKYEGNKKFMDHNPIFKYIAEKNLEMYQDLYRRYNFKVKLGKRVTKKIVSTKRDEIVARPEEYVKNLNPARLVRKLGPDFRQVYLKLFPLKIDDSPSAESSKLLKYYPKRRQYELMVSTYNQLYATKLQDSPSLIDEYILGMISDPDEREQLAKKTYGDSGRYLIYYRPDHCFTAIKERMNFTKYSYDRAILVAFVVESCLMNDDYATLLEVSKYVNQRFKNDSTEVQLKLVVTLVSKKCDFNKLSEEHWIEIRKLTERVDLRNIFGYNSTHLFLKYVEFLLRCSRPITDEVLHFFKKNKFNVNSVSYIKSESARKTFLLSLVELAPVVATNGCEELDCKLLVACKKYKIAISVFDFPRLMKSVRSTLVDGKNIEAKLLAEAVQIVVCTEHRNDEIEELRQLFWKNVQLATPFSTRWFLTHRPDLVAQHLTTFLTFCLETKEINKDRKMWTRLKCYTHLNIDRETVEFCTSRLTNQEFKLANCLPLLMPPPDFLTLLESYRPTSFVVDLESQESSQRFRIQQTLLRSLKNIPLKETSLRVILQFCSGDYLPSCISSLYSAFYKTPTNQIGSYLDDLKNRKAVSVKKHGFYLTSALLDVATVLNDLRFCELDQSVNITFKYFLRNPSEEAWLLFRSKLCHLNKENETVLKLVINKPVPRLYRSQYFEILWEILQQSHAKYKRMFLKSVRPETILELKSELLVQVIDSQGFGGEIDRIVSQYLIDGQSPDRFDVVFSSLQKYKMAPEFSSKRIYNFIHTFFTTYMGRPQTDTRLIEEFVSRFQRIFPQNETFEEWVTLALVKLKNQTPNSLSVAIIQLHNNLLAKYGETITEVFANNLKKLLPHFYKTSPEMYQLYYLLLTCNKSVADVLLVVKLLPNLTPEDRQSFECYEKMLSYLDEVNLAVVQLHLNLHFKSQKAPQEISFYTNMKKYGINRASWLCPGAIRNKGEIFWG